jgi:hypothetical protein
MPTMASHAAFTADHGQLEATEASPESSFCTKDHRACRACLPRGASPTPYGVTLGVRREVVTYRVVDDVNEAGSRSQEQPNREEKSDIEGKKVPRSIHRRT